MIIYFINDLATLHKVFDSIIQRYGVNTIWTLIVCFLALHPTATETTLLFCVYNSHAFVF